VRVRAGLFEISRWSCTPSTLLTVGTLILPTTISLASRTIVWNFTIVTSSGTREQECQVKE